ncbi:MAG: hypothetical protein IOC87_15465 [Rhodobacter sp.]|nr:hypothetical protein [Rhodobacter sp.]MCA3549146.1 hypothetical protein [Rhodobacter sp.]
MTIDPATKKAPAERAVMEIWRATRKPHSAAQKTGIVLSGLRGRGSIAQLCRKEGIDQSLHYGWPGW